MIYWNVILKKFNELNESSFASWKQVFDQLYLKEFKTLEEIRELTDRAVSRASLTSKMISLGIKIRPKGGENSSGSFKGISIPLSEEDLSKPNSELARIHSVHPSTISRKKKRFLETRNPF